MMAERVLLCYIGENIPKLANRQKEASPAKPKTKGKKK
jgi:hypothetical protein